MPRLPMMVFLVLLWLAIGADSVSAQAAGYCDGGKQEHARGDVYGYRYVVAPGDTLYSIANRFCTPVERLQQLNGIQNPNVLLAGTVLEVPGLGPTLPQGCSSPFVSITSPVSGASVGSTFNISGHGCGLSQSDVVILVQDSAGQEVGRITTPLIRSSASEATYTFSTFVAIANGQGATLRLTAYAGNATSGTIQITFIGVPAACSPFSPFAIYEPQTGSPVSASFDISGVAGSNCRVTVTARDSNGVPLGEASADSGASTQWRTRLTLPNGISNGAYIVLDAYTQTGARASTTVTFSGASGGSYRDLDPARCQLYAAYTGVVSLANPDGPRVRSLSGGSYLTARRVVLFEGQLWYAITLAYSAPDEWVSASDVQATGDCRL